MNDSVDRVVSNWLDESDAEAVFDDFSTESCEKIASSFLIHGLLTDHVRHDDDVIEGRISRVMDAIDSGQTETRRQSAKSSSRRRLTLLYSAATVAALLLLMFVLIEPQQNAQAAKRALDRLIETASLPIDRTYEVSVVEEYPQNKRPRNLPKDRWKTESKEQIDGGKLFVRGADKYVFARLMRDGERRLTGCDGMQSWAFRENGPVHVSSDLSRFRGGIPGQQQGIPFMNIHLHLSQLNEGYEIELDSDTSRSANGTELSLLSGTRKSRDVRGPKKIEIWFDESNGTVHEMTFIGLPRGGGGPKTVSLKLIDQSDLGEDFFSHESHHEPDHRIRFEE